MVKAQRLDMVTLMAARSPSPHTVAMARAKLFTATMLVSMPPTVRDTCPSVDTTTMDKTNLSMAFNHTDRTSRASMVSRDSMELKDSTESTPTLMVSRDSMVSKDSMESTESSVASSP